MAIRYFIDLDCAPRRELGEDNLLELLLRWELAESVSNDYREQHGVADERLMRFEQRRASAESRPRAEQTTVALVREECANLWTMGGHCRGCPASLNGTAYGCHGSVGLPISRAAEEWLLSRIGPPGSRSLELFVDAATRSDTKGFLGRWRANGILESREPVPAERGEFRISSDAPLRLLLLAGDIQPPHALGLLMHFNALATDNGLAGDDIISLIDRLNATGTASGAPHLEFAIRPEPADDESTREFKMMLYAVYVAFSLEAPLAVRM